MAKRKRLRNYQLIAEKDTVIPKILEIGERKIIKSTRIVDYSVFKKTAKEKARLKRLKAKSKLPE